MPQRYAQKKEEGQKGRGGDYSPVIGGSAMGMRCWRERYHDEGDSGKGDTLGGLAWICGHCLV